MGTAAGTATFSSFLPYAAANPTAVMVWHGGATLAVGSVGLEAFLSGSNILVYDAISAATATLIDAATFAVNPTYFQIAGSYIV